MQYLLKENLPILTFTFVIIVLLSSIIKTYIISKHDKDAGKRRNIWDYSLLPGLEKALHNTPWQYSLLSSFLLIFLVVFLISGNAIFLELLKANFVLLVGSMLKIDWNEKPNNEEK